MVVVAAVVVAAVVGVVVVVVVVIVVVVVFWLLWLLWLLWLSWFVCVCCFWMLLFLMEYYCWSGWFSCLPFISTEHTILSELGFLCCWNTYSTRRSCCCWSSAWAKCHVCVIENLEFSYTVLLSKQNSHFWWAILTHFVVREASATLLIWSLLKSNGICPLGLRCWDVANQGGSGKTLWNTNKYKINAKQGPGANAK